MICIHFCVLFQEQDFFPSGWSMQKNQGSARKPVILAFLTVCGIIFGMQLLLPAVFGSARLKNRDLSGTASSGGCRSSGKRTGEI